VTGDPGETGAGGGGEGAGGFVVGAVIGTLGGYFGGGGSGGGGLGGSAIRGALQQAAKLQQLSARREVLAAKLQYAEIDAQSRFAPGEKRFLEVEPKVTPTVQKMIDKLGALKAAGKVHRAARQEKGLAREQAKLAPQATYTYVAQYGPNNGPPLRGSNDWRG